MGRNARELAMKNFDPRTNAEALLAVYERVAAAVPGASVPRAACAAEQRLA